MNEKLFQNRTVVLGLSPMDGRDYVGRAVDIDPEGLVILASDSAELLLRGSIAGLHIKTLHVTPRAPQGQRYDLAMDLLRPCLDRAGGRVIHRAE